MKSVMLSIKPQYCELIASGKKTVEVRKTKPKIEVPFKCYIYETKDNKRKYYDIFHANTIGKVIGEFVCDNIFPIWAGYIGKQGDDCLTYDEREQYLAEKGGCGWHISNLKIYDKPKELSEFRKPCIYGEESERPCFTCDKSGYASDMHLYCFNTVTKPPQSWCYVEELE